MTNDEAKALAVLCQTQAIYWRYSDDAPEEGMPRVRAVEWFSEDGADKWPEIRFSAQAKTRPACDIDAAELVTLTCTPIQLGGAPG